MVLEESIELTTSWKTLQQVTDWIRFADTKATAVLAGSGIVGGLLVSASPPMVQLRTLDPPGLLFFISVALAGSAAICCLLTLVPQLGSDRNSLIYFDNIARSFRGRGQLYVEHYVELLASHDAMLREIALQIWCNSIVAHRKFRRVSWGTMLLVLAMVCSGAFGILEGLTGR
jgi:hypothetical protein